MEALLAYQGPMKHVNHAHRLVAPTGRLVEDPETGESKDINEIVAELDRQEELQRQEELRRQEIARVAELRARDERGNEALVALLNRMRTASPGSMTVQLPQLALVPGMTTGRYELTPELAEALANSGAHIVTYKLNTTNPRDPYLMVNERMDHGQFSRPSPGHNYGWDEGSRSREAPPVPSRELSEDPFS